MPPRKTLTYLESATFTMHQEGWLIAEIADVIKASTETVECILRDAIQKMNEDDAEVQAQPLWMVAK